MSKIGIITINDINNYGNRLQNYAIDYLLKKRGHEVIDWIDVFSKEDWVNRTSNPLKKIVKKLIPLYFCKKTNPYPEHLERKKSFTEFNNLFCTSLPPIRVRKNKTINNILENERFDYFIVGSDQVWNPNFFSNTYLSTLAFVSPEKRIALSPSIGVNQLPNKEVSTFAKELAKFKALSCREKQGADIISEITGRRCETLIDPTLMLDENEWNLIAKKPSFFDKKKDYLLLYFLGNITPSYWDSIQTAAKINDLEIINLYDSNSKFFSCGPAEFLWLIKNAKGVVTDSFHATIFSFIFERPVYCLERKDEKLTMSSRLQNLFSILDMKKLGIDDLTETIIPDKMIYEKLNLFHEQVKFNEFLDNALL